MHSPLGRDLFQFPIKAISSLAHHRLLNIRFVCLRRPYPRRFEIIFDLEFVLLGL